jgi:uncharacterized protein
MKDWDGLYRHMSVLLQEKLPSYLTYHTWEHTLHVLNSAAYIAHQENLNREEIILIKTGALLHDAGFILVNEKHELKSVGIALKALPPFGYNEKEINIVSGLIQATAIPQTPENKLECVLADADLEYLGTDDFKKIGDTLFTEMQYFNPSLTRRQWNDIQIEFLKNHHYHTDFCNRYRAPLKAKHLNELIQEQGSGILK